MKTNKILMIVLFFLFIMLLHGCGDEFLGEVKPETSQSIASLRGSIADLDVCVNGGYGSIFSPAGGGSFYEAMEWNSDLYYANPAEKSGWINGHAGNSYRHSYAGKDWTQHVYVMQWGGFGINMANVAIETVETGMVDKDPRKVTQGDRVVGESKLIRSLVYWRQTVLLANNYHASTLENYSTVLRDKPVIGMSDIPARIRTVKEMYDFIIADLKDAQSKLPEKYDQTKDHPATYIIRMRKDAATAALAKVYFQMNDLDNALAQVDMLLGPVSATGSAKYPLATDVTSNFRILGNQNYGPDQGKEIIYAAEGSSAQKWTADNKWGYYQMTRPKPITRAQSRLQLGNPYLDLFDTEKDKRYEEWVEMTTGPKYWQKKFSLAGVNMPIFRAAEFHLMRAEILARKDQINNAIIEMDLVRQRAGLDPYEFTTKEDLIQEIIDERAREMLGEGVRHLDNLRLGALEGRMVPLGQRDAAEKEHVGGVDELPWNSPFFVYDMPTNEILNNPGLYNFK
jgi:starch-binding outer membrane protein, SusD/RagB family